MTQYDVMMNKTKGSNLKVISSHHKLREAIHAYSEAKESNKYWRVCICKYLRYKDKGEVHHWHKSVVLLSFWLWYFKEVFLSRREWTMYFLGCLMGVCMTLLILSLIALGGR